MSPMYEYTPEKTYHCAKCAIIRQNIYEPCLTCGHKRIIEGIPPKAKLEKIQIKQRSSPKSYKKLGQCCVIVGLFLGIIQVLLLLAFFAPLFILIGLIPYKGILLTAQILFPGALGMVLLMQGILWQESDSTRIKYLRDAALIWLTLSAICIIGWSEIMRLLLQLLSKN